MDAKVVSILKDYRKFGYSPINLKLTKKANGFYTQKLYELFRSWSNKEEPEEITIDELRKVLCLEGTSYNIYGNIKKRVLVPAIKEIQEKLNMKVNYKEIIGARRKVIALKFTLEDKEPRHYTFKSVKKSKKFTTKKAPEANVTTVNYDELLNNILQDAQNLDVNITATHTKYLIPKFGQEATYKAIDKMLEKIIVEGAKIEVPVDYVRQEINKINEAPAEEIKENTTVPEQKKAPENKENILREVEKNFEKNLDLDLEIQDVLRNLENNKIVIEPKELVQLKQKYGSIILNSAIDILIKNNAIKKINNHLNYLNSILENKKNESAVKGTKASNSNSSKPSNFANFTQREYDYDKLENQLLGWASDEEYDEE